MIGKNDYYHSRGITIKACKKVCNSLGLNPNYINHLMVAFSILKTKYALR